MEDICLKILIVDTYYQPFLNKIYQQTPGLSQSSYLEQEQVLMDACFGTSDFYSSNLTKLGIEAIDLVANCHHLQKQWVIEFAPDLLRNQNIGSTDWFFNVLKKQIQFHKPDILFVHDINWVDEQLLTECKEFTSFIIGQNASPIRGNFKPSAYNLLLSSIPHYVENFRSQGTPSEYFRLGFGKNILSKTPQFPSRQLQTVFVGGYSAHHQAGTKQLEAIAHHVPIEFWGYGGESLPETSPIRQRYHGEAWALDMYTILGRAKIALNRHIGIAGKYANNMRLYEATGMGACLLTDAKENLGQLFELDREVVTYRSTEECVEKIRYLLEHDDERAAIAKAGQARTLREHTYAHRMQELVEIIKRHWKPNLPTAALTPPPEIPDMHGSPVKSNPVKQTLIYSDAEASDALTTVALNLATQFAQIGHAVTYITSELPPDIRSKLETTTLKLHFLDWNPRQHFYRSLTDKDSPKRLFESLLKTENSSILFIDACPISNLAAKQAAIELNLSYSVCVGSASEIVARQFTSILGTASEFLKQAQSVSVTSEQDLNSLRTHFGLAGDRGRVLVGVSAIPAYIPNLATAQASSLPTIPNKPHWEYLPQGWSTQDPTILGWNVQSILDTQKQKWTDFANALQGTTPIGMSHESGNVSGADYGTHNTMMSFGYVLALAARHKTKISILDWGSGIGHYYLIAKALLPDVEIEYYGKDLPLLCQGGREVLPQVTFYERDEDCFQRQYDLIVASSSVQYSQNWEEVVGNLSRATRGYLYITRLPIVHQSPSFVVVQRPYAYGYHTEYMGWFFNRQAFIQRISQEGMTFLREFLIAEKYPVPNAPEMGEARGFLFQARGEF